MTEQIVCQVTPAQIKQGHYLLARYNTITDFLTAVMVISDRNRLPGPPAGEHVRYALIGTGSDKLPGQPLDEFVEEHCASWDGATPVNLFFSQITAGIERWEPAITQHQPAHPPGASGGEIATSATGGPAPAHSEVLSDGHKALIDNDPRNATENAGEAHGAVVGGSPPGASNPIG